MYFKVTTVVSVRNEKEEVKLNFETYIYYNKW